MGSARILILLIALVAGGAAFFLTTNGQRPAEVVVDAVPKREVEETIKVLVANKEIDQGAVLSEKRVKWVKWPKSALPKDYITEDDKAFIQTISQMRARQKIPVNYPIVNGNTVRHGDSGMMAAILTPGMRAVTVNVNAEETAGGFILPGDRVDVYVSGQHPDDPSGPVIASLLLSDVRVVAIDQDIELDEDENSVVGRTVTLELLPGQVAPFIASRDGADITLALKSIFEGAVPTGTDSIAVDEVIVLRFGQG